MPSPKKVKSKMICGNVVSRAGLGVEVTVSKIKIETDKFIAIKTSKRTDGKGMIKIKRASTAPTPTAFPNAIEKNSFRFVSAIGPHPAPYKNAPLRDAAFFIFKLIQMAVYNRYSPIIFRWYYIT